MRFRNRRFHALSLTLVLLAAPFVFAAPKDDSCDITSSPAATLLLPYFEVSADRSETTILSVTNVSHEEQVGRVTLWTDYSYPVITFNIYLTGYDTQQLNLHDIIYRGIIAPNSGTGATISPTGPYSDPNPDLDGTLCGELPGALPPVYLRRMQSAFTLGVTPAFGPFPACTTAGGVHQNAVGYATIDVVENCGFLSPADPGYFDDISHDNVLIGDYEQVNTVQNTSAGNQMVHLRSVAKDSNGKTKLDRTFYSRYQNGGTADGRQPLPSTFAAHWSDTPARQTSLKIWREGVTGAGAACADYLQNSALPVEEIVLFDEEENVVGTNDDATLPETSDVSISNPAVFPRTSGTSGWVYLNLDSGAGSAPSQNWVIVSNHGPGRESELDAHVLENGCAPATPVTEVSGGSGTLGTGGQ